MPTVSVQELAFSYGSGRKILDNISFTIEPGEIFVIAGLSGCGKTTLCHILCGIIPSLIKGSLSGSVLIDCEPVGSPSSAARRVGLVFQDSDAQIIATTVEDELAFGLENLCVPPEEIRRKVDETAKKLKLSPLLLKNPTELSGGQKKLLCIGSVLSLEPEVIILDEPLNSLDEEGRRLTVDAIAELKRQGRTVIIVEHDLSLVGYADRWMLLDKGKIAALDSPESLLQDKKLLTELEMWFD